MQRDLQPVPHHNLAVALGCTAPRMQEFDRVVTSLLRDGKNMTEIIQHMNDRGDLTDAEWTAVIFSLGAYFSEASRKRQGGWLRIDEQEPPFMRDVIVFRNSAFGRRFLASRRTDGVWCWADMTPVRNPEELTHWMPLPDPPTLLEGVQ